MQNKLLSSLLLAVLTGFSTVGCAGVTTSSSQQPTDLSQPIQVSQQAPEFNIVLASNPTTGYSWMVRDYDKSLLTLEGHDFIKPNQQIPGKGGIEVWKFKANPAAFNGPHTLKINMLYARPWNINDKSTGQQITVVTR